MLRQPDPRLSNIALSPHTIVGGHVNTVTINTNTPYTPNTVMKEGQRSHVDTVIDFDIYGSVALKVADSEAEISSLTQQMEAYQIMNAQLEESRRCQEVLMQRSQQQFEQKK